MHLPPHRREHVYKIETEKKQRQWAHYFVMAASIETILMCVMYSKNYGLEMKSQPVESYPHFIEEQA